MYRTSATAMTGMDRLDRWLAKPETWRALVVVAVVVHVGFVLGPFDVLAPGDPWVTGRALWRGEVPYRDFLFEYPPGPLLSCLVAALVPHGWATSVLALQAIACEVGVLLLLRDDRAATRRWVLVATLSFPFLSGGFDALAMFSLFWATALLSRGDGRGWWVAGAGAVVKLFPGVVWGWCRRRFATGLAVLGLTIVVLLAPLLIAPRDSTYIGFNLERGVEQEAVGASLAFLGNQVRSEETRIEYRFRANEVVEAGGPALVAAAVFGLLAVAVAVTCMTRGESTDGWRASLALLLLVLCASKVLSPQFIAIPAPLFALLGGAWYAAGLSLVLLTLGAFQMESRGDLFMTVIAVRNLLLVGVAIAAAVRVLRLPGSPRS